MKNRIDPYFIEIDERFTLYFFRRVCFTSATYGDDRKTTNL